MSLMPSPLRGWLDRLLGRGDAACTVPTFDGVLKPNQTLEDAQVHAVLDAPTDLATDGRALLVADGRRLLRIAPEGGAVSELARFDADLSAIACRDRSVAVALDGRRVQVHRLSADGLALERSAADPGWDGASGGRWTSINALAFLPDGSLLATQGSATHAVGEWCRDLMTLGRSGAAWRLHANGTDPLASDLGHAFGALPAADGSAWISESWRHRVVRVAGGAGGRSTVVLDRLPGYPSRLSPAADGGAWLTVFAPRTQLVELVLREKAYRLRMIAEVDPRYWVAPALASGRDFLEPLQGGGVKTMGVLKPWAPPRSYGLVIRLDAGGNPVSSLHSRVGGRHHGVVAAVECAGSLFILAKGSGCLLRLPLAECGQATAQSPSDVRDGEIPA